MKIFAEKVYNKIDKPAKILYQMGKVETSSGEPFLIEELSN